MHAVVDIRYELPDELHRRAKSAAALQGVSLKQFIEDALRAAVERAEKDQRR